LNSLLSTILTRVAPLKETHPENMEQTIQTGVIAGGWNYVFMAYAVALLCLGLYATSLWVRRRQDMP